MGLIATSKIADCDRCFAKNTPCRKRAKTYLCLSCCRQDDVSKQLKRQKEKVAVRSLNQYQKQIGSVPKGSAELNRFFENVHRQMTGRCRHCNGKTQKDKPNYKNSVAHILPKAYFPSVATHPENWVELCFYGESCHTNFDNKMLDLMDMNCFDEIVTKFVKIYPSIAENEKRRIPPILLEYLKTEQ